MRVYLGGPINACSDEEAKDWREAVKPILAARDYTWEDPMDRDYRGRELEPGLAQTIVSEDLAALRRCQCALFNCTRPSWGTAMEIVYAHQERIWVVVVLPAYSVPSPWLLTHAEIRCATIEQVAETL